MSLFESYERRIGQILPVLNKYDIKDLDEAKQICLDKGFDPYEIVKGVQPICFENACWAYTVGAAIAIKKDCTKASDAASAIGEGLQSFCIPGSVADDRKVGLGHGNLASMLLSDESSCFAFLAGHESFAAAEGAIGIANSANQVREEPLRVILNGLGKGHRSQVGTIYSTKVKGPRYLELTEGYITEIGLDEDDEIIGYKYINMGVMLDLIKDGTDPMEAIEKASGQYGRFEDAVKKIDPRKE